MGVACRPRPHPHWLARATPTPLSARELYTAFVRSFAGGDHPFPGMARRRASPAMTCTPLCPPPPPWHSGCSQHDRDGEAEPPVPSQTSMRGVALACATTPCWPCISGRSTGLCTHHAVTQLALRMGKGSMAASSPLMTRMMVAGWRLPLYEGLKACRYCARGKVISGGHVLLPPPSLLATCEKVTGW